jgi:multiple sugar transport system permease protein
MGTWMYAGNMIIYLAGLQAIPTQLYESVEIDGGNSVQKFFHITIPMMTPILFFQIIMQLVLCLHVFEIGYVMTRGGPENATLFFNLQLYYRAFTDFRMGIACAMAWVLFLIIIGLTIVLFKTSNRWVYYAGERR